MDEEDSQFVSADLKGIKRDNVGILESNNKQVTITNIPSGVNLEFENDYNLENVKFKIEAETNGTNKFKLTLDLSKAKATIPININGYGQVDLPLIKDGKLIKTADMSEILKNSSSSTDNKGGRPVKRNRKSKKTQKRRQNRRS